MTPEEIDQWIMKLRIYSDRCSSSEEWVPYSDSLRAAIKIIDQLRTTEADAYRRGILEEREACITTCGETALVLAVVCSFSADQSYHFGKFAAALKSRPQP